MGIKRLIQGTGILPTTSLRSLSRGILLAALVGVVAGLGAVAFHLMCVISTHVALVLGARYEQGGPANDVTWQDLTDAAHRGGQVRLWLLVVIPTLGGLASGWLVYRFAPEAEGHGTDAAIDAYHYRGGLIRPRVPLVKMLASAITLGSGGSGGREGPIAQIGAGFGSYLATRLRLSNSERRSLLAAGLGAGIGAIFHAPLAGAIFACEVLYRDPDFEADNLIPSFIATSVAFSLYSLAFGHAAFEPLFAGADQLSFTKPLTLLLPLAVLALAMSAASLIYTKAVYGVSTLFAKLPLPRPLRPALGAGLSGLFAVGLWYAMGPLGAEAQHDSLSVLSFGYGILQKVLTIGPSTPVIAATLLVAVGLGKLLTTALTIGSGGSGGVFGPSMVIGGTLGCVVGLAFAYWLPDVVGQQDVVIFAILGMASFFSAAANTPVSTLIMVSEMCSSYVLLMPSMWVCALAYLVSRGWSIYQKQVPSRRDSPAHRGDFIIDVLGGLTVRDAIGHGTTDFVTVPFNMALRDMSYLLTDTRQACFPVLDGQGAYCGMFSLNDIRQFLYDSPVGELAVAADLVNHTRQPLTLQMDLSSAISQFGDDGFEELPVMEAQESTKVVGLLRRQDLIATYSTRLLAMRREQQL